MNKMYTQISEAIVEGDNSAALELVQQALDAGLPPLEILNEGATKGMEIIGDLFNEGEAFLPELVIAGDCMKEIVALVLSRMDSKDSANLQKATVIIGQASGDVHDIGKNVVAALLEVNGYQVIDLGTDVNPMDIVASAEQNKADIIACSTLLTSSMPFMEDIVAYLEDGGSRDKYHYIVGGGPVTAEFAKNIKADGWAKTAFDCVQLCNQLIDKGNATKGCETLVVQQ